MKPCRRWRPGTVAGIFLAAAMAGWPATLAGASVAGPPASYVLTVMPGQQARATDPGPATGLAATAGDKQVSLSWTPPASDGGAAIIGYDVYLGTSSHGESSAPVNNSLIAATSYQVAGLINELLTGSADSPWELVPR